MSEPTPVPEDAGGGSRTATVPSLETRAPETTAMRNGSHGPAAGGSYGAGQPDGVLPGDQRTADDVEAGIVALWRSYGASRAQELRDRLVLHYAALVKYDAGRVGTGLPAPVDVG